MLLSLFGLGRQALACKEELLAAQIDLTSLTAANLKGWDASHLKALRIRMQTELPAAANGEIASRAKLSRYADLTLTAEGMLDLPFDEGALIQLGFKRQPSFTHEWQSDLLSRTPLNGSRDALVIDSSASLGLVMEWMKKGQLISRFEKWNVYKVQFRFPNPNGKGHLRVDMVPCFADESRRYPLLLVSHCVANTCDVDIREVESFEMVEKYAHLFLFDGFRESAIDKVYQLGHDYLFKTFPAEDEIKKALDSITILTHLGYVVDPFAIEAKFWVKRNEASPVITRALAAIRDFAAKGIVVVPAGMMPKNEKSPLVAKIKLTGYRHDQTLAENYVNTILGFSGPMTPQQFTELYSTDMRNWTHFRKLKDLDDVAKIANSLIDRVLRANGTTDEFEILKWQEDDWTAFDFIRAIDYMQQSGFTYDAAANQWIKR